MTTHAEIDRWSSSSTSRNNNIQQRDTMPLLHRPGQQRRTIFRSASTGHGEEEEGTGNVLCSSYSPSKPSRSRLSKSAQLAFSVLTDGAPPPLAKGPPATAMRPPALFGGRQQRPSRAGGVRASASSSTGNLGDLPAGPSEEEKSASSSSSPPNKGAANTAIPTTGYCYQKPLRKSCVSVGSSLCDLSGAATGAYYKPLGLKSCFSVGSSLCGLSGSAAGRGNSSTPVRSLQQQRTMKKSVSFHKIEIREHPRALGDHPSVREGPALGLDWYTEEGGRGRTFAYHLEDYETHKSCGGTAARRDKRQFWVPRAERELILRQQAGVTSADIYKAQREASRIRQSRQANKANKANHMRQFWSESDLENSADRQQRQRQRHQQQPRKGEAQRGDGGCNSNKEEDNEAELQRLLDQAQRARQQVERQQQQQQQQQLQQQERDPQNTTAGATTTTATVTSSPQQDEMRGRPMLSFLPSLAGPPPPSSSSSSGDGDGDDDADLLEF